MLYNFMQAFETEFFRAFFAFFTSFFISVVFGKYVIAWLTNKQKEGQPLRDDGTNANIENKKGVPNMGGIIIIAGVLGSVLLWNRLDSVYIHIAIVISLLGGLIGFFDDFQKLRFKNIAGLSGKIRLMLEAFLGLLLFFWLYYLEPTDYTTTVRLPFFENLEINLSYGYALLVMIIIMSTCNCVNFTDGLDGLASGSMVFSMLTFGIIAWFASVFGSSFVMDVPPVVDGEELMILCFATVGALLGFLWYNSFPANVFMGDTGSLFLGTLLGVVAVLLKQEILLIVVGGVFVIEGLSDIIQILYYKKTKKRVFLMAPLHHHFEKKGVHEVKIVTRFWILSMLFSILALFIVYKPAE